MGKQQKSGKAGTSKRRGNLFKKAAELSTLCGARVAIVTISDEGKVTTFPDSDTVIQSYLAGKVSSRSASGGNALRDSRRKGCKEGGTKQGVEEGAGETRQGKEKVCDVAAEEGGGLMLKDLNEAWDEQCD
ncbi:agamous-like MADS-box protein AGL62 [Herrania umbratica]|uniref:Agamous-like MADS-box protein AGL62 n=1 Tax=Herrania umbratica TaxID=108875 RepID=A0A6J1AMF9_9ROSI|nr:agamous-like MADS-box protein AGL62 [Herrania umbratica]